MATLIREITMALALVALLAGAATAGDRILRSADGKLIPVWRDTQALDDGAKLRRAQADPLVIAALLACAPPSGTRVVVSDGGFFSSMIIVVAGPLAGCRGVVDNAYLR